MGTTSGGDHRRPMINITINRIRWHLADEGITGALEAVSAGEKGRRGYRKVDTETKTVFVKAFVEKGLPGLLRNYLCPRGKKEYDMAAYLLSRGVATPKPLGYGLATRNSYVAQEWMEGTTFLEKWHEEKERKELLLSLADLLALLKKHHVRHNDLHAGNILCTSRGLSLIDLHSMRIKDGFDETDEVSNLSHALAMLYKEMDEEDRNGFFLRYDPLRFSLLRTRTEKTIRGMFTRWVRSKEKRAFSDTSKTRWVQDRLYIAGMDGRADGGLSEVLKRDRKIVVERHTDHVRKVYLTRRRLKKAWQTHVVLVYMNLPVIPQTYCLGGRTLRSPGYVCMEDLGAYGEELDRFLDRRYDGMSVRERRIFVGNLAGFLGGLLRKSVIHRDLKGCNIFVLFDGSIRLLDVEDIVFQEPDAESVRRMLIQLNTTLPGRISGMDRIRFFLALTHALDFNKKALFDNVVRASRSSEIVYEGVAGLQRENW